MNVLNRLKLGQRLYAGFAVVLLLLVSLTGVAWFGLSASQASTERVVQMSKRNAAAEEWTASTRLNINRVLAVARSKNDPAVDAHFKPLIAATTSRINELQKQLEEQISSARGKELLAKVGEQRKAYIAVRKTYFEALKNGDVAGSDQILTSGLLPAADSYSASQTELVDYQRTLVDQAVQESAATVQGQSMLLLALAGAAIVLAMLLAWRLTRSVTQPLAEAVAISRDVAQGNLGLQVHTDRRDELGDLIRALADMKDSLVRTVGQVRLATDSINTASVEIATGNQDLSARTEQTASNLQQTAASMEQLTSTVRNSADAARQANQLAASAAQVAQRGGSVVSQVVTTMDDINASSRKINDIIGVIDGIAFQTNILALNAAVEAARAGEQGRGFAVVAGEVRNLAQRSAQAAKEIKGLIGASVDKVEAGSKLVADAGQTMSEIVGSVQRVTDIIGEITAAAGEQSDGIGQVNTAVSQLDQMTQQNAALVEQSAAAAQSLKEQAVRLAEVMQVFKLDTTTQGMVPVAAAAAVPAPTAAAPRAAAKPAAAKPAPIKAAPAKSAPALAPVAKAPVEPLRREPVMAARGSDEGDWESF